MVERAYSTFDDPAIAPVIALGEGRFALELWHGPTYAFKDMALQVLPLLLTASRTKCGQDGCILILVATSGDTGKAALEGFSDVDGTAISVFFPRDGVSRVQKLQMMTHAGKNVNVGSIEGNFDDAQTAVKRAFSDTDFAATLREQGVVLSSANSINWGRLVPQIAYYFWSYAQLLKQQAIQPGDPINFAVPTGNFGNILAGYYAKQMGLPIAKLICASNANNVLTDFFNQGHYDCTRHFYRTMSPSMDILISSNLERLLFELSGRDDAQVRQWMHELSQNGSYTIDADLRSTLQRDFFAGYCDDERTAKAIRSMFEQAGYLMDPHTAVANCVLDDYREKTGDKTPCVVVSTASPFKFSPDVLRSLTGEAVDIDEFETVEALARISHTKPPEGILKLRSLPLLHEDMISPADLETYLLSKIPKICR